MISVVSQFEVNGKEINTTEQLVEEFKPCSYQRVDSF